MSVHGFPFQDSSPSPVTQVAQVALRALTPKDPPPICMQTDKKQTDPLETKEEWVTQILVLVLPPTKPVS